MGQQTVKNENLFWDILLLSDYFSLSKLSEVQELE